MAKRIRVDIEKLFTNYVQTNFPNGYVIAVSSGATPAELLYDIDIIVCDDKTDFISNWKDEKMFGSYNYMYGFLNSVKIIES